MKLKFIVYQTSNKKEPLTEWIDSLDVKTQTVIDTRFKRVIFGNLGDCKPIVGSKGIWELRIDYGPGFRIYFGRDKNTIIVLLIGGDKKSQTRDIEKAKRYWLDYKESSNDQKIS